MTERLAPVVDLQQARERRLKARRKIVQSANRIRLGRGRYVRSTIRAREIPAPKLLTMRHLQQAVAICRHWGAVDDATLMAAGFKIPERRAGQVAPVARRGKRAA